MVSLTQPNSQDFHQLHVYPVFKVSEMKYIPDFRIDAPIVESRLVNVTYHSMLDYLNIGPIMCSP